jgi:hypothetical protein
MMKEFLIHLGEAATSTTALAAYVVVVFAWALKVWLSHQLQGKAEKILRQFESDTARNDALTTLLGSSPPAGLPRKDVMRWAKLQTQHRSRILAVTAYMATLTAAIVIVAIALFQPTEREVRKPPVLIDSVVQ